MRRWQLVLIPGDGIGQEVIPEAARVLKSVLPDLELIDAEAGWGTFQRLGVSVPPTTLELIRRTGAALFGAVQSPTYKVEGYRSTILTMRQALDLHANVRPVRSLPLPNMRPNVDLLIVRENTEGLYIGIEAHDGDVAVAQRRITRQASARIGRVAARLARRRLTIVHKANILPVSDGLFRDTVRAVALEERIDLDIDELLVDVAAHKLTCCPETFDTIVAPNLYGDILSDIAATWCGGLGMAPSINLGYEIAVAEPVHGSAPDIAGQGIANPIAAILSGALLCRYIWQHEQAARAIEQAVATALAEGAATPDLGGNLTTREMTDAIIAALA